MLCVQIIGFPIIDGVANESHSKSLVVDAQRNRAELMA